MVSTCTKLCLGYGGTVVLRFALRHALRYGLACVVLQMVQQTVLALHAALPW